MTINITKDVLYESRNCTFDIPNGKVGQNCAIGKAIFDLFGDYSWVGSSEIIINKDGFSSILNTLTNHILLNLSNYADYEIKLPFEAEEFIHRFDKSTPEERVNMTPFSFDIDIPDEVIELVGGVEEVYKILEESKTMQLVG